jgi:hypothetical protein
MHLPNLHFVILLLYNNLINIFYFQEAFSQSDFQKGLELNKQIYKKTCIYYITRKILKKYTGESSKIAKKVSVKCRNTSREFYLSVQVVPVCYGLISL